MMIKNKLSIYLLASQLIFLAGSLHAQEVTIEGYTPPNDQPTTPVQSNTIPTTKTLPSSSLSSDEIKKILNTAASHVKEWDKYASNLLNCTPNSFDVPDPSLLGMLSTVTNKIENGQDLSRDQLQEIISRANLTYTIMGWSNDKCYVIIQFPNPNEQSDKNDVLRCFYPKESLPFLAQAAHKLATLKLEGSGNEPVTSSDSDDQKMNDLMKKYCTTQKG